MEKKRKIALITAFIISLSAAGYRINEETRLPITKVIFLNKSNDGLYDTFTGEKVFGFKDSHDLDTDTKEKVIRLEDTIKNNSNLEDDFWGDFGGVMYYEEKGKGIIERAFDSVVDSVNVMVKQK